MSKNYYRDVTHVLTNHGWSLRRTAKGSHEVWHGPHGKGRVVVPRNLKKRTTANGILKQARTGEKI